MWTICLLSLKRHYNNNLSLLSNEKRKDVKDNFYITSF